MLGQRVAAPGCKHAGSWHAPAQGISCSAGLYRRHSYTSRSGRACGVKVYAKQRIVFLGTPDVAAESLKGLLEASRAPDAQFEVALVVSQPGKPKGRGNKSTPVPTPVEQLARDWGFTDSQILCPVKAREESFLAAMAEAAPDLAVTAAYGNMLPQRFLDIPRLGTLNIHPSLLPRYRGAAPVQRAVQDGVSETGVSVAYTVLACDAGPVLAQEKAAVDPDIQAPELLAALFRRGTGLLLSRLPDVFAGNGPALAVPQDESQVLHAAKISREEAQLDWSQAALVLHNRVRAFAGWPGTTGSFLLQADDSTSISAAPEPLEVKIVRTRAVSVSGSAHQHQAQLQQGEVVWSGDEMLVPCGEGRSQALVVTHVQPPTKKVMGVKDFKNGLRGKRLLVAQTTLTTTTTSLGQTVSSTAAR